MHSGRDGVDRCLVGVDRYSRPKDRSSPAAGYKTRAAVQKGIKSVQPTRRAPRWWTQPGRAISVGSARSVPRVAHPTRPSTATARPLANRAARTATNQSLVDDLDVAHAGDAR